MNVLRAFAPVLSRTSIVNAKVPDRVGVPATLASGRFSKVFPEERVPSGTVPDTSLNLKVDGPAGSLLTMYPR